MKKVISCLILLLVLVSCNKPNLNGHYHLEWGNRSSFQTWNIKNNRIRINDSVCDDRKQICYGMPIKFKGDSIFLPWVDTDYAAKYQIDRKGTITMTTNYNDNYDTLRLFPKENCINSEAYLNKKASNLKSSFDLVSLYYNTHRESDFPKNAQNELIIGKKDGIPFYIFNDKLLEFSNQSFNISKPNKSKEIWIYIDIKVQFKEVVVILKELVDKKYKIYFTSKDENENNEQVIIFKKSIAKIDKNENATIINTCEYCEKHPTKKIDSVLNFKIFGKDSCLVNNEITDFHQLRKYTARFMGQNRSTRLKTQIQLEINSDILFENYFELLSDIEFLNKELSDITYYHGKDDPDQKEILDKQNSLQPNQLHLEFPLRIKEIIKPF